MSEPPARDLGLAVSRMGAALCLMGFPPICAPLVTRVSGWYRGRDRVQVRRTCAGGLLKKGAAIIALAGALCSRGHGTRGPRRYRTRGGAAHFVDCGELSAGLVWVVTPW